MLRSLPRPLALGLCSGTAALTGLFIAVAGPAGIAAPNRFTAAVAATPGGAAPQTFSSTADVTWGTPPDPVRPRFAQEVDAIAEAGGRLFLAGGFTNLADPSGTAAEPPQPYLAVLDPDTGAPVAGSTFNATAHPDGPVYALALSADGRRLYVGGAFNHIGGKAIPKLAALDVDTGAWDPGFSPPAPNAYVRAMAVGTGRLYIAGAFTNLGAAERPGVAALDPHTGGLIDGFNPPHNYGGAFAGNTGKPVEDPTGASNPGNVRDLAIAAGGHIVMAGGDFLHFGTPPGADPHHQHGGLVALDATTGALTSWQPLNSRPTFGLATWPADDRVVFAAEGGTGGVIAAFRTGGNTNPAWTGRMDGDAVDVAATTARLYVVGHYDYVLGKHASCGGQTHCTGGRPGDHISHKVSAFDPITGDQDLRFTAQLNTPEGPKVACIGARHLYIGGNFTKVNSQAGTRYRNQPGLAVFPAEPGTTTR